MKINNIFLQALLACAAFSMAGCSSDDEAFVLRSDNHVDLPYDTTSGTFTVCTNGEWSVTSDASWFTISPSQGTGDGTTREEVTVTPKQNTGAARTDSLYLIAAGKKLGIGINQAEGYLQVGTATFTGVLRKDKTASGCNISIAYAKALVGQTYTATVTMTGATGGITVANYSYTIKTPTGTILIPVTGIPTTAGDITFTVSPGLPDAANQTVTTTIKTNELISLDFSKFIYGGDAANLAKGIIVAASATGTSASTVKDDDGTGYTFNPNGVIVSCTQGTDGSNDVFLTMSNSYRVSRGVTAWSGSKIYERPGYIKVGTGSAAGYIQSPAFTGLGNETGTVVVTFDAMAWYQNTGGVTPLKITVSGGGTASISSFDLPERDNGVTLVPWSTVTVTITNATSATQIKVEPESTSATYYRFLFDNFKAVVQE